MSSSSGYRNTDYQKTLKNYRLDAVSLSDQMEGAVSFRGLFDEDYSWDQMFSRHAEISPEAEISERADEVTALAEKSGRSIAKKACGNLEEMMQHLSGGDESGADFLFHLLNDYYIPSLTEKREALAAECERLKRKNEERRADLRITAEEAAGASRLGGDREVRAIRFLGDADDYLMYFAKQRQNENLIRVISTILSYCAKSLPDSPGSPAAPGLQNPDKGTSPGAARQEVTLSFPRRCTITTDDGERYSVAGSDGIDRYCSAELTLTQALSAAENLMGRV